MRHPPGNEPTNEGHAFTCAPLVHMTFSALENNGGIMHLGGERSAVRELRFIFGEQHLVQANW